MAKKFEVKWSGVFEVMRSGQCQSLVGQIAQRVAASASSSAGVSGGEQVQADVLGPEISGNKEGGRARAAVIIRHPSPAGRERGIRALISSL
jgi:hypothetical protein